MGKISINELADNLAKDVLTAEKYKRIKVRTLLKRFNSEKRTKDNATKTTELLSERNILLNPSIMKFKFIK